MTDFDYEVRQKKALVPSARRRVSGSRSRRCTLPHENLTRKELKKMNGEVNEINMNRPVNYYTLTKMSKEVQVEYIRNLQRTYNASSSMLVDCLGVAKPTVRKYLISLGLNQDRSVKRATAEQRVAWTQFLTQANDSDAEVNREPEAEAEPAQKPHVVSLDDPVEIDHFTYEVRGTAYAVCKNLISIIGAGAKGQFCITFVPEGGEENGQTESR